MTTLALTPAPLRRLFRRVDFAPQPRDEALAALLEAWQRAREGTIYPSAGLLDADRLDPSGRTAFVFEALPGSRDYALRKGCEALRPILGRLSAGNRLSEAPHPRAAVPLRRLLDFARDTGEPMLAEFTTRGHGGRGRAVEVLLAPLSTDGRTVDAVLGGLSLRSIPEGAVRSSAAVAAHRARPLIFGLGTGGGFGAAVAARLGTEPAAHEERAFEDGEFKIRPLVDVAGREVCVVDSLEADAAHSANDKLCRMLFFIGGLKDAGARRVTAVAPYLCYARKDRRTKEHDPVTTRYVAQLFEAVGTDRIVTMEVHNPAAFENAFRIPTVHLDANDLFVRHVAAHLGGREIAVVSPDAGGAKRAEAFRGSLEAAIGRPVAKGIMEKHRSGGVVTGDLFAGDVKGRAVVIVDDLISAGTTMARAAAASKARGAASVTVIATHAVFSDGAPALVRAGDRRGGGDRHGAGETAGSGCGEEPPDRAEGGRDLRRGDRIPLRIGSAAALTSIKVAKSPVPRIGA